MLAELTPELRQTQIASIVEGCFERCLYKSEWVLRGVLRGAGTVGVRTKDAQALVTALSVAERALMVLDDFSDETLSANKDLFATKGALDMLVSFSEPPPRVIERQVRRGQLPVASRILGLLGPSMYAPAIGSMIKYDRPKLMATLTIDMIEPHVETVIDGLLRDNVAYQSDERALKLLSRLSDETLLKYADAFTWAVSELVIHSKCGEEGTAARRILQLLHQTILIQIKYI